VSASLLSESSEAASALLQTATERVVAAIWGDVLQIQRVSSEDNFLDIGGDSLSAMMILARVEDEFNVELDVQTLLDCGTVDALARVIDAACRLGTGPD
jgi:acyl carrier protein